MNDPIVKLSSPIIIDNAKIETIDKSKIINDIFCIKEGCKIINSEKIIHAEIKFSLVYEEKENKIKLMCSLYDINNKENQYALTFEYIEDEELIELIDQVISNDKNIFEITTLKNKTNIFKDDIYKALLKEKHMVMFKNKEIDILYGAINDESIFNRIYIDNSYNIKVGELISKTPIKEDKDGLYVIELFLTNNLGLRIKLHKDISTLHETSTDDIGSRNKAALVNILSSYEFIRYLKITYTKNQCEVFDCNVDKSFSINDKINLPSLSMNDFGTEATIMELSNYFYDNNELNDIKNIYSLNRGFFIKKIDIIKYMLG